MLGSVTREGIGWKRESTGEVEVRVRVRRRGGERRWVVGEGRRRRIRGFVLLHLFEREQERWRWCVVSFVAELVEFHSMMD